MSKVYDKDKPFPASARRSKAQLLRAVLFRVWEMRIDKDGIGKTFKEYYDFKMDEYISERVNELRKW